LVRVYAPAFLDVANFNTHATKLRDLGRINNQDALNIAQKETYSVKSSLLSMWDAVYVTIRKDPTWDQAWSNSRSHIRKYQLETQIRIVQEIPNLIGSTGVEKEPTRQNSLIISSVATKIIIWKAAISMDLADMVTKLNLVEKKMEVSAEDLIKGERK
jgi:hypothetical protein